MTGPLYNVVYAGEIIAPDRDQVIREFAALFKIDIARAERVLDARRRVLKKGVTEKQAQIYSKKLSDIGVLVSLEAQRKGGVNVLPNPEPDASALPGRQTPEVSSADEATSEEAISEEATREEGAEQSPAVEPLTVAEVEEPSQGNTNFAAIEDTSKVKRLPFNFTGEGAEFFKIWIVNILLTIITLGIYSAWAKVRTNRYFYSNTRLEGASFEYLADPVKILKGRIIAVVFFVLYTLAQQLFPLLAPILVAVLLLALPWMIANSLRFRMRNTAFRNIRFGFEGGLWGAAKSYSLMFLLVPLTFGLIIPYMLYVQSRYLVDNSRYGVDQFSFAVSPREYYRVYLIAFGAVLAIAAFGALFAQAVPVLGGLVFIAGYALVITYVKVETINLMFDNSHLGDHGFASSLQLWPYFSLYFVNTVLIILTLGLFYPWAKVRIARYRAECLLMLAQGSLNHYVSTQEQETSALGEELGDVFDFDFGF